MKVEKETAKAEFDKWFDSKKLPNHKREGDQQNLEEIIIDAISEGYLIVNEDFTLTQQLRWPIDSASNKMNELTFVHRITKGVLDAKLAHVNQKDNSARLNATIAAITNQPLGLIKAMDTVDIELAGCIASYFL